MYNLYINGNQPVKCNLIYIKFSYIYFIFRFFSLDKNQSIRILFPKINEMKSYQYYQFCSLSNKIFTYTLTIIIFLSVPL